MSGERQNEGAGFLDSRPARWALIYGLPAVTCLLVGSAIFVSRMGVAQDIHLMGSEQMQIGEDGAARALAYDESGRLLDSVAVSLSITPDGGQPHPLCSATSPAGAPAADLAFTVPGDLAEGPATLVAEVETALGSETIRAPVTLHKELPHRSLFLPPPPNDRPVPRRHEGTLGHIQVELLPFGHALVPNLDNVLFVRTTDKTSGAPVVAELELELTGGGLKKALPATITTDRLGLEVLPVHPLANELTIKVRDLASAGGGGTTSSSKGGADGGQARQADASGDTSAEAGNSTVDGGPSVNELTLHVATTPAQLVHRVANPCPDGVAPLKIRVESLHSTRPLYVDMYVESRFDKALTGHIHKTVGRLEVPNVRPGIVLVQSYTVPFTPGRAFSAHHLYVRESGQPEEAVLTNIAKHLQAKNIDTAYVNALLEANELRSGPGFERTAAFLLSRLDKGYFPPQRLQRSAEVRSEELTRFQEDFKIKIAIAVGLMGLVVAALLAYAFTIAAFRARQRRLLWDAETGADQDELYVTSMGRPKGLDRFRSVVQIALMVGVVAVGFVLLAILVAAMSWQGSG